MVRTLQQPPDRAVEAIINPEFSGVVDFLNANVEHVPAGAGRDPGGAAAARETADRQAHRAETHGSGRVNTAGNGSPEGEPERRETRRQTARGSPKGPARGKRDGSNERERTSQF